MNVSWMTEAELHYACVFLNVCIGVTVGGSGDERVGEDQSEPSSLSPPVAADSQANVLLLRDRK